MMAGLEEARSDVIVGGGEIAAAEDVESGRGGMMDEPKARRDSAAVIGVVTAGEGTGKDDVVDGAGVALRLLAARRGSRIVAPPKCPGMVGGGIAGGGCTRLGGACHAGAARRRRPWW